MQCVLFNQVRFWFYLNFKNITIAIFCIIIIIAFVTVILCTELWYSLQDIIAIIKEVVVNRKCRSNPNRFCYICGQVTLSDRWSPITNFVKKSYHAYFGVKLGDQEKPLRLTYAVKYMLKGCDAAATRSKRVFHSVSQWFGEKERIILSTVISVWQIWMVSIEKTSNMWSILTCHLPLSQCLMEQKFQFQHHPTILIRCPLLAKKWMWWLCWWLSCVSYGFAIQPNGMAAIHRLLNQKFEGRASPQWQQGCFCSSGSLSADVEKL